MAISDADMIEAWKKVLTLSQLKGGEVVTVITEAFETTVRVG